MVKKNKNDLLKEMQKISEDVEKYKKEVESILVVIDKLEKEYFELAEKIKSE